MILHEGLFWCDGGGIADIQMRMYTQNIRFNERSLSSTVILFVYF